MNRYCKNCNVEFGGEGYNTNKCPVCNQRLRMGRQAKSGQGGKTWKLNQEKQD